MPAAEEGYTKVGDLTAHYCAAGGGPPVILVHGLGASGGWWRESLQPLGRFYRLLVPDLPGHGLSDKPRDGYGLTLGSQFLAGFMSGLGVNRAALVGHSMGGTLALEIALRFPGRVTHLVLVDSAGLGKELVWLLRMLTVPLVGELMTAPTRMSMRALMGKLFCRTAPDGFFEELCRERTAGVKRSVLSILRVGVGIRGLHAPVIALDRLAQLQVPTLIVWGAGDRIVPVAHAYAAHRLIPDSRLHVISDCGHCPQLERPDEFNRVVLDFLDNVPPPFRIEKAS